MKKIVFVYHNMLHKFWVFNYLFGFSLRLIWRAVTHDLSKFSGQEMKIFSETQHKLKASMFGSDEYNSLLKELGPALDHHYRNNPHHPQYYRLWKCPLCAGIFDSESAPESDCYEGKPRFCPTCCPTGSMFEAQLEPHTGIGGMTLMDIVEMFYDWWAATKKHSNGDIAKSINYNSGRFGMDEQLVSIFKQTIRGSHGKR